MTALKWIGTGCTVLVLLAAAAPAQADSRRDKIAKPAKRAYASAPVRHQWTGFYVGGNLGFGVAGITDSAPLAVSSMMYGAVGGVQAGFNYQIESWVLGIEADIQASNQSQAYTRNIPIVGDLTVGHKIPYFGTVRARIGYAFQCACVMAYGTIGVAYGSYQPYASALGVTVSTTYSNVALAVGAGVEWAVSDRWTTKLEALYIDTGDIGDAVTLPVIGPINARLRDLVTRIGVNYHF
jgi:outer membrane immunogenic protein